MSSQENIMSAGDHSSTTSPSTADRSRLDGRVKAVLAVLAVLALYGATRFFNLPELMRQALDAIHGLGGWAPALFIVLYIVSTVLFFPGSILTLGAGAIFGLIGVVYVSVGATIGATLAFLIGRYAARDWVAKKVQGNPRFKAIDEAVGEEGWKIVALTRLSPVFPFALLNYGFGLTRVSLKAYFWPTWLGILPGTLMYVYLGSLANSLTALSKEGEQARSPWEWTLYGLGLAATIAVTVYVTRIARKALAQKASV